MGDLEETKKCPYCAEIIKKEAIVCRFCGYDLKSGKPSSPPAPSVPHEPIKKVKARSGVMDGVKIGVGMFIVLPLIIIGILFFSGYLTTHMMIGKVGKSKQTIAKAQIESLCTAIDTYKLDTDKYPAQEDGLSALISNPSNVENWHGPYLARKSVYKDPWGNDYVYTYPGNNGEFDIISYGADGEEGGEGEDADIKDDEI